MHLLAPLLIFSSLSSILASPLSISPLDKIPTLVEKEGQASANTSCPADPIREMEKIVFDYTIDEFEAARNAVLRSKGPQCFKWSSDGCTKSPDKPFGWNFKPSCHRHDFAWNNFRARHVYTKSNKKRIEEQFERDMKDLCDSEGMVSKLFCKGAAEGYAFCVRKYPRNRATDPGP